LKLKILIFCKITIKYKNRAAIAIKNRRIISLDPLSKSVGAATKKRDSNSKIKVLPRTLNREINSKSNQGESVTLAIGELIE